MSYTEETSCRVRSHPVSYATTRSPRRWMTHRLRLSLFYPALRNPPSHVNNHDVQDYFVGPSGRARARALRSCCHGGRFFDGEREFRRRTSAERIQHSLDFNVSLRSLACFGHGG